MASHRKKHYMYVRYVPLIHDPLMKAPLLISPIHVWSCIIGMIKKDVASWPLKPEQYSQDTSNKTWHKCVYGWFDVFCLYRSDSDPVCLLLFKKNISCSICCLLLLLSGLSDSPVSFSLCFFLLILTGFCLQQFCLSAQGTIFSHVDS